MKSKLSRRNFIRASAAVSASAMFLPKLQANAKASRFGEFNVGIQSYSLRKFKVDDVIKISGELGLSHIEFYSGHFSTTSSPEQIESMKKKLAANGLTMYGHGVNKFTKDHEKNRALFEFAKAAGLKNISANPTSDAFDSLDKLCEEYDIRISIHNHGPGALYDSVDSVLNAVKGRHKNVGACADLGHFIRSSEDPVRVIRLLGDRLFGIHLKDFKEKQKKTKGVILGEGHLDVEGVFAALKAVKFPKDGCLSIEYEENPADPVDDIKKCLDVTAKAIASLK